MRITRETLHNLIDDMQDSELDELANFIGYLNMKRGNEMLSISDHDVYEVTEPEEEELLLDALNGDNPLISGEEINKMLGQ